MQLELRERIEAYIVNVEKALNQIDRSKLDLSEERLVEIAEAYLSDAKYYFAKGDYATSLACIAYAEGLIDSLRYLGKIDISWEPLSRLLGRPKVLVAGGFEIIHPGHIYLLKKAWEVGRVYVVVARDSSFKKFKNREPVIPEEQRLKVVENIKYVHKAVLGDEKDYLKPVEEIKPDIIILGPDQWPQEDKLKNELKSRGLLKVEVKRLNKRIDGHLYSVTKIIEKILDTYNCEHTHSK